MSASFTFNGGLWWIAAAVAILVVGWLVYEVVTAPLRPDWDPDNVRAEGGGGWGYALVEGDEVAARRRERAARRVERCREREGASLRRVQPVSPPRSGDGA